MAITVHIETESTTILYDKHNINANGIHITATIIGEAGDIFPIPGTDNYEFKITPNNFGNVVAANGGSLTVSISKLDELTYTATALVVGDSYGQCQVDGNKAGVKTTWVADPVQISVVPSTDKITIMNKFAPSLITSTDIGDPKVLSSSYTYTTLLLTDIDGAHACECPISFIIDNVRTQPDSQTGAFYTTNKTLIYPEPLKRGSDKSKSTITQYTNEDGQVTLYVGSNNNSGYINFQASATTATTDLGYIYVFDDRPGTEAPAPHANIGPDLTNYKRDEFNVTTDNDSVAEDEFLGIFLNGKFQNQITGQEISNNDGTASTSAQTSDLIPGTTTNPAKNGLIGHRTSKGDLIRSKEYQFMISSPIPVPDPQPKNQILGPLRQPKGLVINLGSIYDANNNPRDFIASVNVIQDVTTLAAKMTYTAKVGDTISLHAIFQGDYEDDDNFVKKSFKYKTVLTAEDLNKDDLSIPIPHDDISGYGTPKDPSKSSNYQMYYEYIPEGSDGDIAASTIVKGVLSTRTI